MSDLEEYKLKEVEELSREEKVKRYEWRVKFMGKVIDTWRGQMSEPERYGTFDDWRYAEIHGAGLTELMDEMAALACDVDPGAVPLWLSMKKNIIDIRIANYKIARRIDGPPDLPIPTPEEEVAAEVEKREAYRTGGANLLPKVPEPNTEQPGGTNDEK